MPPVKTEGAPVKLLKKLVDVASKIEAIDAEGVNPKFQYKFVEEAQVVAEVRKVLYGEGVLLTTSIDKVELTKYDRGEKQLPMVATQLSLTFTFYDTASGETLALDWFCEAMDTGDKGIAKALTSGLKYFLLKNFLIPKGGDDPEADGKVDEHADTAKPFPATAPAKSAPAPKPAGAGAKPEDPDRKKYREALYTALREAKVETSVANIKDMISQATGLNVSTLYEADADHFKAAAKFVYDNMLEAPYPEALQEQDGDIPF